MNTNLLSILAGAATVGGFLLSIAVGIVWLAVLWRTRAKLCAIEKLVTRINGSAPFSAEERAAKTVIPPPTDC